MNSLFDIAPNYPSGFSYFPDFLTLEEEEYLIAILSRLELKTFLFRGYEARRKVASFGYDYHFNDRTISEGIPIPKEFNFLIHKVADYLKTDYTQFKELLATEYPVGSVINWHRDAPPFEMIVGISLSSNCNFKLRPYDKTKQTRGSIISIPVNRRSLYIMKGSVREYWEHSITEMKQIRYSITLRTLRK